MSYKTGGVLFFFSFILFFLLHLKLHSYFQYGNPADPALYIQAQLFEISHHLTLSCFFINSNIATPAIGVNPKELENHFGRLSIPAHSLQYITLYFAFLPVNRIRTEKGLSIP